MPTPDAATMFASLGTLSSYLDFSEMISFGENWINGKVIEAFLHYKLGAAHVIYGADLMFMCAALAAAAYLVVVTVDRANYYIFGSGTYDSTTNTWSSSTTYGWYYLTGGWSDIGNLRGLFELFTLLAW
jgi:hypothetical protein